MACQSFHGKYDTLEPTFVDLWSSLHPHTSINIPDHNCQIHIFIIVISTKMPLFFYWFLLLGVSWLQSKSPKYVSWDNIDRFDHIRLVVLCLVVWLVGLLCRRFCHCLVKKIDFFAFIFVLPLYGIVAFIHFNVARMAG